MRLSSKSKRKQIDVDSLGAFGVRGVPGLSEHFAQLVIKRRTLSALCVDECKWKSYLPAAQEVATIEEAVIR